MTAGCSSSWDGTTSEALPQTDKWGKIILHCLRSSDIPTCRDWMLDTCCSEAEIPSLAGIEKKEILLKIQHPETSIQHHGAVSSNHGILPKLEIKFKILN